MQLSADKKKKKTNQKFQNENLLAETGNSINELPHRTVTTGEKSLILKTEQQNFPIKGILVKMLCCCC